MCLLNGLYKIILLLAFVCSHDWSLFVVEQNRTSCCCDGTYIVHVTFTSISQLSVCSENLKFWNDKNYGRKNSCRLLRGSFWCFYFSGDMIGILYRFNKWYLMQTHSNQKARIVCCQTINCSIFIFTLGDCIRCFEARKKKFTFHWQWRGDKSPKWNQNQLSPNENYHKLRYARLKWCHYKSQ